jgi:adenylate cyclase
MEEEWKNKHVRDFIHRLANNYTVIRYDRHGCGLSDRDRTDFSLEKEVRDLESIIDHLTLSHFSLFAMSQGGPTAIAYAAKRPESVSHLILYGTYSRGAASAPPELKKALCNLVRTSWGFGSKALAEVFIPGGSKEDLEYFKNWQRKAVEGEMAARLLEAEEHFDLTGLLPTINTPTLVLHRKGDRACSIEGGRELARLIPSAKFVLLEGIDHLPWAGDSGSVLSAIEKFLGIEEVTISDSLIKSHSKKQEFKRKLAAILSADVKGYSILMADDEVATISTLREYRNIMSVCIDDRGGRVVDAVGDNLLAEFDSAVEAVKCAVEIQEKLKDKNQIFPDDKKLEFRMGVNIGDVIQDGERIFGDGVNVAARIEGLADAGGICVSRNTYDQIKNKLELSFEYLAEHEVKNIKEPVRVYKVLMDAGSPKPLVEEQLELPDKPSIAVLPFTNMSGDPSQEYFSDGLTEHIINGLCKVSNLFVIARNSSFAYKGKAVSVKQIAKELGVRYILEGSVQRAGNRVRITAQLIDANTDYHMWSENYDRDLEDIFALQDEITMKLINVMQIKLIYGDQARIWSGSTNNIQAVDMQMRGADCVFRINKKDNKQAQYYFKEAISIDKKYAMPYAMLGFTHLLDLLYGWSESIIKSFEEAEKNAVKASTLNESFDVPHSLMAWIYLFKRRHEEAIKEGEWAIELNPNGAEAYAGLAFVLNYSDETELAIKFIKQALRLNPIPPSHYYFWLAAAYRIRGQYEKAIKNLKKALIGNSDLLTPNLYLTASYSSLNRTEEAHKAAEEVLRIDPNFSLEYHKNILPYKNQETLNNYIDALRKAGLPD